MGNGFVIWFSRSYKGIIIGLIAFAAVMLVVLAMQHVNASRPAEGAEAGPIPTFTSAPDPRPEAAFLGDSYTVGYGANSTTQSLPWQVAADMGWRPVTRGVSSTGYLAESKAGNDTFLARAGTIPSDADYAIVMGSLNDASAFAAHKDEYVASVNKTLDTMSKTAPDAKLIVVGPFWPYSPDDGNIREMDDDIRAAAASHHATFIDPLAEGWMTEQDIASNMLADKIHPNQAGYDALSDHLVSSLKAALK